MPVPRIIAVVLLVALGLPCRASAAPPPNIVLIVTDDLGYGDVGAYGSTAIPTPRIDQMAAEGLRLTRCYATASTCTPTRYSLLTGEYAWRQRARRTAILDGDAPLAIEPGSPTLPEVLRRAGYRTALVGKWHLGIGDGRQPVDFNGHVGPGPLEVGFDEAFYIPATVDRVPCVFIENHAVHRLDPSDPLAISYRRKIGDEPTGLERPALLKYPADRQHSGTIVNGISRIGFMDGGEAAWWVDEDMTDVLAARARGFIAANRDRPFFLYLGTHDPHVPHAPHERFAGESAAGRRGDSIVQADWLVGAVLDALGEANLDERTLVVLTSDNGPTIYDGYLDGSLKANGAHRPAGPYRGGKYTVYEGGCRVPGIVRWHGTIQPAVSDGLVALVDLLPSLAKIAGIQRLPTSVGADAIDNSAALLDASAASVREEIVLQGVGGRALIRGRWKFTPAQNAPEGSDAGRGADTTDRRFVEVEIPQDQLFNLADDPGETINVIDQYPQRAAAMRARLQAIVEGR